DTRARARSDEQKGITLVLPQKPIRPTPALSAYATKMGRSLVLATMATTRFVLRFLGQESREYLQVLRVFSKYVNVEYEALSKYGLSLCPPREPLPSRSGRLPILRAH